MKRKDREELRGNDEKTLAKKAGDLKKQIAAVRQNLMTKEVKNRHEGKTLRAKLAAVLTVLREKQLLQKKGSV